MNIVKIKLKQKQVELIKAQNELIKLYVAYTQDVSLKKRETNSKSSTSSKQQEPYETMIQELTEKVNTLNIEVDCLNNLIEEDIQQKCKMSNFFYKEYERSHKKSRRG